MTRGRRVATVIVVVATGAATAVLGLTLPDPAPETITGTVRCASGSAVTGVWVEAFSGGRGFADRTPGDGGATRFRTGLPDGGTYRLDVGCGGTEEHWGTRSRSPDLTGVDSRLVCMDGADDPRRGSCAAGG